MRMTTVSYKKNVHIILGTLLLLCFDLYNVSIVYNMKISDITRRSQISERGEEGPQTKGFGMTFTTIDQWRQTYNNITQNCIAEMLTLLYSPNNWYISSQVAFGHVRNTFPFFEPFRKAITQFDDVLFSGGYAIKINDRTRLTASGLLGIQYTKMLYLLVQSLERDTLDLGLNWISRIPTLKVMTIFC